MSVSRSQKRLHEGLGVCAAALAGVILVGVVLVGVADSAAANDRHHRERARVVFDFDDFRFELKQPVAHPVHRLTAKVTKRWKREYRELARRERELERRQRALAQARLELERRRIARARRGNRDAYGIGWRDRPTGRVGAADCPRGARRGGV